MKNLIYTIFILFIAAGAMAQTYSGDLNSPDGTYDRIFTTGEDVTCNLPSTFSGTGVGVPYDVITVFAATSGAYTFDVPPTSTIDDGVMSLHCVFDPLDASTGLQIYNDDETGLLPGFVANLTAGEQYDLVISLFGPTNLGGGTFDLVVTGPDEVLFDMAPDVPTVPTMGEWGVIALMLLMLIASVVYIRQEKTVLTD